MKYKLLSQFPSSFYYVNITSFISENELIEKKPSIKSNQLYNSILLKTYIIDVRTHEKLQ